MKKPTKTAAHVMSQLDMEFRQKVDRSKDDAFEVGDTVLVKAYDHKSQKRPAQYRGVVIAIHNKGLSTSFRIINTYDSEKFEVRVGPRCCVFKHVIVQGLVAYSQIGACSFCCGSLLWCLASLFLTTKNTCGVRAQMSFPLYSPLLGPVKILTKNFIGDETKKVRRAKLYHVREFANDKLEI